MNACYPHASPSCVINSLSAVDVKLVGAAGVGAGVRDELFFKACIHPHREHSQGGEIRTSQRSDTTLGDAPSAEPAPARTLLPDPHRGSGIFSRYKDGAKQPS